MTPQELRKWAADASAEEIEAAIRRIRESTSVLEGALIRKLSREHRASHRKPIPAGELAAVAVMLWSRRFGR